jgi:hypothetical protein
VFMTLMYMTTVCKLRNNENNTATAVHCKNWLVEMTKKNWSPGCIWENQLKMVVLTNKINH